MRIASLALYGLFIVTLTACPQALGDSAESVDLPLEGTVWTLVGLGHTSLPVPADGRRVTLRLDPAHNRIQGFGGCNTLFGAYGVSGNRIEISNLGSTRMACPDGMDLEMRFLRVLGQASRWQISGNRLTLLDDENQTLARFAAPDHLPTQ